MLLEEVSLDKILSHIYNSSSLEMNYLKYEKNEWVKIEFSKPIIDDNLSLDFFITWHIPSSCVCNYSISVRILNVISEEYETQLNALGLSLEMDIVFIVQNLPQPHMYHI